MMLQEDKQLQDLCQLIHRQIGLDCKQYKLNYLKRRLAVRMRATKKKNYFEYMLLLKSDPHEYEWLLDRLTINVSNFFRDPTVFIQFKAVVLSAWQDRPQVKVWSAGCANGEEPYTLAILLQEGLPRKCNWEILATDIDPTVLEHARLGIYRNEALKNVPVDLKMKYFDFDGESWRVKPEIRQKVKFKIHDLTGDIPLGTFDLILCRNVLIYFVSELQERLFKNFYSHLNKNGFLILGKTETLLGDVRKLYQALDIRERIYKKIE